MSEPSTLGDNPSPAYLESTSKPSDPTPEAPAPPRRRLGPIPKKNRASHSGTPTDSVSTTPARQGPHLTTKSGPLKEMPSTSKPPTNGAPELHKGSDRKPPNTSTTDVDLRDASVYMNLFRMNKPATSKAGNTVTRPTISFSAHRCVTVWALGISQSISLHR